jgi:hypothetical protein
MKSPSETTVLGPGLHFAFLCSLKSTSTPVAPTPSRFVDFDQPAIGVKRTPARVSSLDFLADQR